MNLTLQTALEHKVLAMADDQLILGHRNAEWCGHAPILEEDVTFANIALDEIAHAISWYGLLAELRGETNDHFANRMIYQRPAADFRSSAFVELARGDWSFSMLRQYLFDVMETLLLDHLEKTDHKGLAHLATKMKVDEYYHHPHTAAWVTHLGKSAPENKERLQSALDLLWPHLDSLFDPLPDEAVIVKAGWMPPADQLRRDWLARVIPHLKESGLHIPTSDSISTKPSRQSRSVDFDALLTSLQAMARLFPAVW
ncbi:MAG: phenylacetate-CoA oxygenase subunit PaaC [Anaerolineae bacterium]|nr:phenylacetate-CoA oxygenase subunit PaaC [Anaerolineae bacterium]